jgi:hypothetical protein
MASLEVVLPSRNVFVDVGVGNFGYPRYRDPVVLRTQQRAHIGNIEI